MDKGMLRDEFERQAEWRAQKAEEYPDDRRNAEAATLCAKLAKTVDTCPDEVISAVSELFDDLQDHEEWDEMKRTLGLWYFPESAEEMCRDFIARRTS